MTRNQLFSLFVMALSALSVRAFDMPFQNFHYDIFYHCGLIDERAAQASIQVSCYDNTYSATLQGHSIPIVGVIYCINDTLRSTFMPAGSVAPASESVDYISGYYRKPHEDHEINWSSPYAYRNISGGGYLSADDATMECVSLTADMLCMFYYAKTVDFPSLAQGQPNDVAIMMPYGDDRTMQIQYCGTTDYNGRQAYRLLANFTYDGSFSSYPITVLIDTEWRVPLCFSAEIAIGHVEMRYSY